MLQPKSKYAIDPQNIANNTAMSLALRELQRIFSGPVFWIIVGFAVMLAALAGPYFTLERLSFPERLVFWGTTIAFSALLMTFLSIYAYRITEVRGWHWATASFLASALGVLPVVGSIYVAEGLATGFAFGWTEMAAPATILMYVAPSLLAVTLVVNLLTEYLQPGRDHAAQAHEDETPPVLLSLLQSKLPHHLGHDIVSVQAHDHHVEVTTPMGSAMILMRLGDAVHDLEALGGLQVHRSWWINLSHIVRTEKSPNGPEVIMTSDQRIPVGRSFRAMFRQVMQSKTG